MSIKVCHESSHFNNYFIRAVKLPRYYSTVNANEVKANQPARLHGRAKLSDRAIRRASSYHHTHDYNNQVFMQP